MTLQRGEQGRAAIGGMRRERSSTLASAASSSSTSVHGTKSTRVTESERAQATSG